MSLTKAVHLMKALETKPYDGQGLPMYCVPSWIFFKIEELPEYQFSIFKLVIVGSPDRRRMKYIMGDFSIL